MKNNPTLQDLYAVDSNAREGERLTWFFRPAPGYKHSCAAAYYYNSIDGRVEHYGHVNVVSDYDGPATFFATLKFEEDNEMLGPQGEFGTIQEAMDAVNYYFEHEEWPKEYWASAQVW